MTTKETELHNQNVFETLEVGDLLEFHRGLYSHWAVYIGNGEVVHLAGEDDDGINQVAGQHLFTISGKTFNKAVVRIDKFWDVVYGSKVHKNNDKDKKWTPYKPAEIVERALSKVGRVGYNIIFNNCEHFVTWCRYNMEKSDQVNSYATGFAAGAAVAVTAGLVALFGRGQKEKENSSKEEY